MPFVTWIPHVLQTLTSPIEAELAATTTWKEEVMGSSE